MSMTLFEALQIAFALQQTQATRCRNGLTGPAPSRPSDEEIGAARLRLDLLQLKDFSEEMRGLILSAYKTLYENPRPQSKEYVLRELFEMGPIKIDAALTYETEQQIHFICEDGSRGFYKHKV